MWMRIIADVTSESCISTHGAAHTPAHAVWTDHVALERFQPVAVSHVNNFNSSDFCLTLQNELR